MSKLRNIAAGFAGALALNVLHETMRKQSDDVPRVDLLGENALQKVLGFFGEHIDQKEDLYKATLAGDIIGNTLYYSMIGSKKSVYVWPKAIAIGLAAGLGAITLPEPLGLDDQPVTKTDEVKVLTVGYYLFGALITAGVLTLLEKK